MQTVKKALALATLSSAVLLALAGGNAQAGTLTIESWRVDDLALWVRFSSSAARVKLR